LNSKLSNFALSEASIVCPAAAAALLDAATFEDREGREFE